VFGEPDQNRLFHLNAHPETDLGRVFAMTPEQESKLGWEEAYAFNSASWLVVFYLANERRPQLTDYIQRLAKAEDPAAAFDAAFGGLAVDQLWRDLATYKQNVLFQQTGLGERRADYKALRLQLPPWKGTIAVRALAKADVAALRGELFLYTFGDEDAAAHRRRARAAADEALALDASHPLALAVRLAVDRDVSEEAIERVRAATRSRETDPRAWQLLGSVLRDSDFLERKAALEKAVALAPDNVAALDALAWDHVRGGRAKEAMPVAVRAATLAPGRSTALDTLAAALAISGRCAEALKLQERAVEIIPQEASSRYKAALTSRLQAFREGCRDVPLK
jgi:tetratricopeptide (TPR) repeat protein